MSSRFGKNYYSFLVDEWCVDGLLEYNLLGVDISLFFAIRGGW